MANGNGEYAVYAKKPDSGVVIVAGALGLAGLFLVFKALGKGDLARLPDPPAGCGLRSGEEMSNPASVTLEGGTATVRVGQTFYIENPTVLYQGPGRDAFTYLRVVQVRGGQAVTVYGSGIAGIHLQPSSAMREMKLVRDDQVQPEGAPQNSLMAYPWPGDPSMPISGAPAEPGSADVWLEIYERCAAADVDGYAAPTFPHAGAYRVPVRRHVYPGRIVFVE